MNLTLGILLALIFAGAGGAIWFYRRGRQSMAARIVKDELKKRNEIDEESKRIDVETKKKIDEGAGDDGSDPRAFWLRGED